MTDKELFEKTFSYLHASDDTLSEVYKAVRRSHTQNHPGRRVWRIVAAAAAFIALLTVTAFAVYHYTVRDAVMEAVPSLSFNRERGPVIAEETYLSLNGFKDSPEYQAYVEWESWNQNWAAENLDWFKDQGVDDSYHEGPENYFRYYNAYAQEQVDKLDEIMEKHGLTVHSTREFFYTEEQLCQVLGIDDILSEDYTVVGEYFYDDGSFRLDAEVFVDGLDFWMTCVNAVKGSITMISSGVPEEYEQWTYTTAAGREVLMFSDDSKTEMIADLGGTYVTVGFDAQNTPYVRGNPPTRQQAEALVEGIDLEALASCFESQNARDAVAASILRHTESGEVFTWPGRTADDEENYANYERELARQQEEYLRDTLQLMGSYEITADGYECTDTYATPPDTRIIDGELCRDVCKNYVREELSIRFRYVCYWDLDDETRIVNAEHFARYNRPSVYDIPDQDTTYGLSVGDYEAYLIESSYSSPDESHGNMSFVWFDSDRDRIFCLYYSYESWTDEEGVTFAYNWDSETNQPIPFTVEDFIALAATVQ